MSRMFAGYNINNIDISKFDISKTTNMDNMFSQCTAKTISLNNLKALGLLSAQGMFKNCKAKVRLPKDKETAHILDCELTKYENDVEIIRQKQTRRIE